MDIKIITYPKKQFDNMVFKKEYNIEDCFISIGYTKSLTWDPTFDTPLKPDTEKFLRVKFDDVIEDFGENNLAFTQENAERIFKFLEHNQPSPTIHIHCQAGQSRSVALGEALKIIFTEIGYNVDLYHTNTYVNPNATVLRIMLENKHLVSSRDENLL